MAKILLAVKKLNFKYTVLNCSENFWSKDLGFSGNISRGRNTISTLNSEFQFLVLFLSTTTYLALSVSMMAQCYHFDLWIQRCDFRDPAKCCLIITKSEWNERSPLPHKTSEVRATLIHPFKKTLSVFTILTILAIICILGFSYQLDCWSHTKCRLTAYGFTLHTLLWVFMRITAM